MAVCGPRNPGRAGGQRAPQLCGGCHTENLAQPVNYNRGFVRPELCWGWGWKWGAVQALLVDEY